MTGRWKLTAAAVMGLWMLVTAARASEPDAVLDRAALVQAALARSGNLRAAKERAQAVLLSAEAEDRLPPPEAMISVWQVPLARPYAANDAGMVMLGVQQTFPAPGALGARREARTQEADMEDASAADLARQIARDVDHSIADYTESIARHRVHARHLEVARRALGLAQARHAAGGSLQDVTTADVEVARIHADVVTDDARTQAARARLNALVGRAAAAPLGSPAVTEAGVPAWSSQEILAAARAKRPELRAAEAARRSRAFELRATEREATRPSFAVAALYFAPVGPSPAHGYGMNGSMSLPWLWGPGEARRRAQEKQVVAAASRLDGERLTIDTEVVTAEASTRSAALRLQVLRDRALPASARALDAARGGYESARTDLATLLGARMAVVAVEMDLVAARAVLDHALADLDAAAGVSVPRRALAMFEEGGADVH